MWTSLCRKASTHVCRKHFSTRAALTICSELSFHLDVTQTGEKERKVKWLWCLQTFPLLRGRVWMDNENKTHQTRRTRLNFELICCLCPGSPLARDGGGDAEADFILTPQIVSTLNKAQFKDPILMCFMHVMGKTGFLYQRNLLKWSLSTKSRAT